MLTKLGTYEGHVRNESRGNTASTRLPGECRVVGTNLTDELDVFSLDVLDDHDLHLGQEVQRQVADCISDISHHYHHLHHQTGQDISKRWYRK